LIRKITLLSLLILAFLSSGVGVSHVFAQARPADFDDVDGYVSTRMKELGIPGAALVIVQGDQIVHLMAVGVADGDGRPVTPQTPFFTGSTGKSFSACPRRRHHVPSRPFLEEGHAAPTVDTSSASCRFAVDLERRNRLCASCEIAYCLRR